MVAGLGVALVFSLTLLLVGCGGPRESHTIADTAPEETTLPSQGPAPDFELTNQDGQRVRLSDFHGQVVLMDFFYASCPDFCPVMNGNFKQVYDAVDEEIRAKVVLLSISFDPLTDTPDTLKEYAQSHGFNVPNWHFLTGTLEEIERVTSAYQIAAQETEPEVHIHPDGTVHVHERDFGHLAQALLIDQEGEVRKAYLGVPQGGEIFSPQLIVRDIEFLLSSRE
ncbi:MAG: SCO family protein [Dehalococcoidia bacterium]